MKAALVGLAMAIVRLACVPTIAGGESGVSDARSGSAFAPSTPLADRSGRIRFGLDFGPQFAWFRFDHPRLLPLPETSYGRRTGFRLGGGMRIALSPAIALETGIGVSSKGMKAEYQDVSTRAGEVAGRTEAVERTEAADRSEMEERTGEEEPTKVTLRERLTYLTIPVLLRASSEIGPVRPFVRLGIEPALLVHARESTEYRGRGVRRTASDDAGMYYRKLDVGLQTGIGLEFPVGFGLGIVGVDHVLGLSNVSRPSAHHPATLEANRNQKVKNRALALRCGIWF